MAEMLFYHLQGQSIDAVLPILLEKTLEKGWRALVRVGDAERIGALDEALWTYRAESFLPHARLGEGDAARQPILLTAGAGLENDPQVIFLVERAFMLESDRAERIVLIFDGEDQDALSEARIAWKNAQNSGHSATYWQIEGGRWVKKA
jgi:DNA polymerase III subunit chi